MAAAQKLCTFAVDDVVAERTRLRTGTLGDSLSRRFQREVHLLPESNTPVIAGVSHIHPLIGAIDCAFKWHYPLTLSPDAVWLAVAQGFSHHITENAETLRTRLVRHRGRVALEAEITEFTVAKFENAIADFSRQIRDASDPVLHETLICDFTTTTPQVRTASEIVLMDTYSSYFEYLVLGVCGVPEITLTGDLEDWERIRSRIEVLETFDLGWWVARLRPIFDELIQTRAGSPNREFWQAIYKPKQAYANTVATGWIADLFPYLSDPPERRRNHVLNCERPHWAVAVEQGVSTRTAHNGAAIESFPSGLCSVPVKLSVLGQPDTDLDLVAGYFAIKQDPATLAISPVMGWSVTARAPDEPVCFLGV